MNSIRNHVQLIGHIGQDPEVKLLESGKKMARISLATNEVYRAKSGDKITDTTWHNVVAWDKTADIVESYLKKGKEVVIQGKLANRSWENKEGKKQYATEIIASEILLIGKA